MNYFLKNIFWGRSVILPTFVLLLTAIISSCNRNSLQLPASTIQSVEETCVLNGINTVVITFTRDTKSSSNKIYAEFKNLTGTVLYDVKILVEMCDGKKETYTDCNKQCVITMDSLETSSDFEIELPYTSEDLTKENIHVGIISYQGLTHFFSGTYTPVVSKFEKAGYVGIYNGLVRGYVLADGNSLFRVKASDSSTSQYTLKGNFISNQDYNGAHIFDINSNSLSPLQLDTVGAGVKFDSLSTGVLFRVKLSIPYDNIETIRIQLKRD